ncbi:hypothetical protein CF326_g851 [Tilletia indica]|nr:hypothetical protein CF326_g851 [Tilletia indica]
MSKPSGGVAALAKRWEAAGASSPSSSKPSSPPSNFSKTQRSTSDALAGAGPAGETSPKTTDGASTPKMRNASSSSDADSSAGAWAGSSANAAAATSTSYPVVTATEISTTSALDPSVGAESLLEPGTTIANPFSAEATSTDDSLSNAIGAASSDSEFLQKSVSTLTDTQKGSPPADSPRRYSLATDTKADLVEVASAVAGNAPANGQDAGMNSVPLAPASIGTASSQASRRQSFSSATDMRRGLSSGSDLDGSEAKSTREEDEVVRDSTHFSVVSLGGEPTSEAIGAKSSTSTTGPASDGAELKGRSRPESQRFTKSSIPGVGASQEETDPDIALIRARVETQSAQLERDPKAWRASIDGAAKIRESFERKMQANATSSPSSDVAYKRSTLRNVSMGPGADSLGAELEAVGGSKSPTSLATEIQETTATTEDITTPTLAQKEHIHENGRHQDSPSTKSESLASVDTTSQVAPLPLPDQPELIHAVLPELNVPNDEEDDEGEESVDWTFWGEIMSKYAEVARTRPQELSHAIRRGIPSALRGMMWQLMSSSKDEELEIIYAFYLKQTSPHEKAIRKDLSRTFPEQDYFADGKGVGQENLFNVIKAYSLYDEECGYCQGMQFVVGPLLLNMPDEEAFSTLARLMKSYDLRGHYIPNMPSLQLRLFQFDRLLEEFLPLLYQHLVRQGVKSSMYAAQWFMTLL